MRITGEMASANRQRLTGRDGDGNPSGCGVNDETACPNAPEDCKWSSDLSYCVGNTWPYYTGKGIELNTVENVTVTGNTVRHVTNSGIRCDKCDNTNIDSNIVYGTCWWTHSATSGVVFAEAKAGGTGINMIVNNVVYANRNMLPFFLTGSVSHFGSGVENYGQWNQFTVVDGSGVYITRNVDYEGTFELKNNISFDNGINGLVVHKTTHANVTVKVENNRIFDNGRTDKTIEGRQNAGGLTINGGSATSNVLLKNNIVTSDVTDDLTYQCFGTCVLTSGSTGNTVCGGAPNSGLDSSAFATGTDCDAQKVDNEA